MNKQRAVEMLRLAAQYIRDNDPEGSIYYDEADCDGYCLADDCDAAAEDLDVEQPTETLAGWETIETAPTDGTVILVYAPRYQDLPAMQSLCAWHPDAGFCVDELRTPTHWMPLPSAPVTKADRP